MAEVLYKAAGRRGRGRRRRRGHGGAAVRGRRPADEGDVVDAEYTEETKES